MKQKIKELLGSRRFWTATLTAASAYFALFELHGFRLHELMDVTAGWLVAVAAIGTIDRFGTKPIGTRLNKLQELLRSRRFWLLTLAAVCRYVSLFDQHGFLLSELFSTVAVWLGTITGVGTLDRLGENLKSGQSAQDPAAPKA